MSLLWSETNDGEHVIVNEGCFNTNTGGEQETVVFALGSCSTAV